MPILALAVVGCGGAGSWTKPGEDAPATRAEFDDCRSLAATVVRTDTNIDQDIIATRSADAQRGGVVQAQNQVMQEHSRDRAGSIIDKCMAAKGFVRAP
jgi:hypothetical protein